MDPNDDPKLEAIGRLAGGIAHDFNNTLMAIIGFAKLAEEALEPDHPARSEIGEVLKAAARGTTLTTQLLAFGRKQTLTPRDVEVDAHIAEIAPVFRRALGARIVLDVHCAAPRAIIHVDPAQLDQAIMNVITNARDALPDGGTVTVTTYEAEGQVVVTVSDSGPGIPATIRSRIFEPFATTKAPGRGTGLGLPVVLGIVAQSGGNVSVESDPRRGAKFSLAFPLAGHAARPAPAARAPGTTSSAPPSYSETILLVEDDPLVREFARRTLARRGYEVITAQNGSIALEIAARRSTPIDLVLADVLMPDTDGMKLAERLRDIWPNIKIVMMSGYADAKITDRACRSLGATFLQKPLSAAALVDRIGEMLASPYPSPTAEH